MNLSSSPYLHTLPDLARNCRQYIFASLPFLVLLFFLRRRSSSQSRRQKKVPQTEERVLILGASSGVGREIALQYARRGAYVFLVARNDDVERAREECVSVHLSAGKSEKVISEVADFSDAEDMLRIRERIEDEWGRLDTLLVIAGVSSLRPLIEITGLERKDGEPLPDANLEGVREGVRIAGAALQGNFYGPLTAAFSFIPLLERTSPSPSVLLLSSLAAVTPAPTRALYGSTKSASLILYQSLAIEHPLIHFSFVLPSTIEGNFRASAVDAGPVREADPNRRGLKREDVAQRCILAVDRGERDVFMHAFNRVVPMLYYTVCPGVVEWFARKKYRYP
ncbi:hypothetical protein ACEPAH_387 [Sanghuangporus vaninii]